MTFIVNSFPFDTSSQAPTAMQDIAREPAASAMPIACRKRSRSDEDDDGKLDEQLERQTGVRGLRKLANLPRGGVGADEPAQFHALPPELNMQLLANMGYISTTQQPSHPSMPRAIDSFSSRISHSPTSSFSDFGGPSTPSDMAGSTESYFTKGLRRESASSSAYPDFNIYPGIDMPAQHTPGLLGMNMSAPPPSVGSQDPNGMQMDGMEEQQPPNTHGDHCKSIPQLHVRSEPGVYSELWASCRDCGLMSKVESPPVSDNLSYSP